MNKLSDVRAAADHVRRSVNIIQVITDELGPPPKTSGMDQVWACPFHSENTPSFYVHSQTQIYKCFGCGVGGDVVKFVQNHMGLPYGEAVRNLANRYQVDITAYERPLTPEELQRERYIHICNQATAWCTQQLCQNQSIRAWYLSDTGFSLEQIVDYDVGYCHSIDALVQHLFQAIPNLTQSELAILEFDNRLLWNNVLVYPVKDILGNTVRFHNKPMTPPTDWGGKYVGTSHRHPLFSNGYFFGLHLLRKRLKELKYSVRVVEGQKGAIASGGLALLGSTLHEDQIHTLQEHGIREVRVAFDGDEAGRTASMRLLDSITLMTNVHVLVVRLPVDAQPDSLVKEFGKPRLDEYFNQAILPIQFYVDARRDVNGQISTQDRFALIHELKDFLQSLPDLHLDMTATYLSKELGVDPASIRSFVGDLKLTKSGLINRDTELAVLRHILLNPHAFSIARRAISDVKVFTVGAYQYVYGVLDQAHREARDANGAESVTVQVIRDKMNALYPHYKDLPKVIDTILITEPKYEFVDALQRTIDLWRRRTGIEQSKSFGAQMQDLGKSSNELITSFRRQLVSSLDVRKDDINTPIDLATRVMQSLQERMMNRSAIVGYDFSQIIDVDGQQHMCLPGLTLAMSGLQRRHQVIISGNTGVGKSLLALQLAVSISICPDYPDQVPTLWIPLEMTEEEISFRIISLISGVDNDRVQSGQMNADEFLRVQRAIDRIAKSQLYIKKPRYGHMDEIFAIYDEYHFKYNIKAAFLDYIQMIIPGTSDKGLARHEVIGKASKTIKLQIADPMDICCVTVAQLNRQDFKEGVAGGVENVGGSYEISQDADEFISIARKTDQQITDEKSLKGNRFLNLDKRRMSSSKIVISAAVDEVCRTLRWKEHIDPGQMMGLQRSVGKI
jgi:DNA primase catalytic core